MLALYEFLQICLMLYGLYHLLLKIFQWTKYYIGRSLLRRQGEVGDRRSLIDSRYIIPENRLKISIVCARDTKIGDHAFLFFEWCDSNVRWFARADFGPSDEKFSDIVRGKPKIEVVIKSDVTSDLNVARKLLGEDNDEYQSFNYPFAEEDISAKIEALDSTAKHHTYSLLGDNSSTSVNSRTNNQNCATWCVNILKTEFGIEFKVDKQYWLTFIRTPKRVVNQAGKTGKSD